MAGAGVAVGGGRDYLGLLLGPQKAVTVGWGTRMVGALDTSSLQPGFLPAGRVRREAWFLETVV